MSDENREMDDLFRQILAVSSHQASSATGSSAQDAIYEQADEVRQSSIQGYVNVTHKGQLYRALRVTWGALDGDKNKSTVLLQANDGLWYKLWFFDTEVKD